MSKKRPKKHTLTEEEKQESERNQYVLRKFYKHTKEHAEVRKRFEEETGERFPNSIAEWRQLAKKYEYPRWGEEGSFSEGAIHDWVIGSVRSAKRGACETRKRTAAMRENCDALADLLVAVRCKGEVAIIAVGEWEAVRDVVHRAAVPLSQLERQLKRLRDGEPPDGEPFVPSDDEIREKKWRGVIEAMESWRISLDDAVAGIALIRDLTCEIAASDPSLGAEAVGVDPQRFRNALRGALKRLDGDYTRLGHQLFAEHRDTSRKLLAEIVGYSNQLRWTDVSVPADPESIETTDDDAGTAECTHSEDFTSVVWFDTRYRFTKGNQAGAIEALWEAWEKGGHSLSQETIGERCGSEAKRFEMRKAFRHKVDGEYKPHPAWGTMIQEESKGCYRLVPPEFTTGSDPAK